MIHAFIRQHESEFPAAMACRVLGVSRSGYHASLARPESDRTTADRALSVLIAASHTASRQGYGAPRILDDLRDVGHRVGQRRVARLMRQTGLRGAFHPRRTSHAGLPATVDGPDLVRRRFTAEAPDQVWCADPAPPRRAGSRSGRARASDAVVGVSSATPSPPD